MPGIVCNQQANFPLGCTWREQDITNKLRDLVAVDGDPLANIEAMRKVALLLCEGMVVREPGEVFGSL